MSVIVAAIAETASNTRERIAGYVEDRANLIREHGQHDPEARRFAALMIEVIASEIRAGFDAS